MGIATRIAVRLTPLPPTVATLLADFSDLGEAAAAVTGIIAAGIIPAALEMMDAAIVEVVEAYVHAGFPTDAAAVLLVEVDGLPGGVEEQTRRVRDVLLAHHARQVRVAATPAERALWWKGRKSAFGAVARIAPNYYLHDCVVPRTRLVEVLAEVGRIAARHDLILGNVFHAGDGNLHPLIVFDRRVPGVLERVHAAGQEIVEACVAAGRHLVRRARHRPGEARRHAPGVLRRRPGGPEVAAGRLRSGGPLQPGEGAAPGRVPLRGHRRPARRGVGVSAGPGDVRRRGGAGRAGAGRRRPDPVGRRRGGSSRAIREVTAPAGVVAHEPAEMIVRVRAGTTLDELRAVVRAGGQDVALEADDPARATVGGILAVGQQRLPAPRARPGARRRPGGDGGDLGGELIRAGAPAGQERDRLRPVPAAWSGRSAPWPCWARWSCDAGPEPEVESWWVAEGADPFAVWPRPCTGRCRCSGTAPGPGWGWPATRPMCAGRPRRCSGRRSGPAEGPPAPARAGAPVAPAPAPCRALPAETGASGPGAGGWPRSASGSCTARPRWPPGWRPAPAPDPAVVGLAPGPQGAIRPGGPAQPGPVGAGRRSGGDRGRRRHRPGGPARRRRRRAGRLRGLRAVPGPLPDLPGHRRGGPVAPGAHRRHARRGRRARPLDATFARLMQTCVQCRACETACPSSVPFGRLMEGARELLAPRTVPWWQRAAYRPARAPPGAGRPDHGGRGRPAGRGSSRARWPAACRCPGCRCGRRPLVATGDDVWLFTGCVMDAWQRDIHRAAIAVLGACGAGVALPGPGAACCGALHVHAGLRDDAVRLARRVMAAFPGSAPILVDSAGCGAAAQGLRPPARHGRGGARSRPGSSTSTSGWPHGPTGSRPLGPAGPRLRIAVQDPCHLRHVQRREASVRVVLEPYGDLVELDDEGRCCGAGGAFSALQPELAGRIRTQKVAVIAATAPDVVASANPGCGLWLAARRRAGPPSGGDRRRPRRGCRAGHGR